MELVIASTGDTPRQSRDWTIWRRSAPRVMGRTLNRRSKLFTAAVTPAIVVSLLGGCTSAPALSGPAPKTPGAPQKTISALLAQWADLTNAAIAATGHTGDWFSDGRWGKVPWDPAAEIVGLAPCTTRGEVDAHQLTGDVRRVAFERDPHPIADTLTSHWESQGFTVELTIDWTDPTGGQSVVLRAERADGVQYVLTATNEQIAPDVTTESSSHPSIQEWAREGSLRGPAPSPTPSSSPAAATKPDGTGWMR